MNVLWYKLELKIEAENILTIFLIFRKFEAEYSYNYILIKKSGVFISTPQSHVRKKLLNPVKVHIQRKFIRYDSYPIHVKVFQRNNSNPNKSIVHHTQW